MRGRQSAGSGHVATLLGSDEAKTRLEAILRVLAGECRVEDACALLGVGEARFHQLRSAALQGALDALAPRPRGRPAAPLVDPAVDRLQREVEELRQELRAARVREEIALVLPRLAAKAVPKKRRKGARRP